jgi:hypothetical protein
MSLLGAEILRFLGAILVEGIEIQAVQTRPALQG